MSIQMVKFIQILFVLFLFFCTLACKKESKEVDTKTYTSATVQYFGDPAVDGCGWKIKVDDVIYSPQELPTTYQHDGLKVLIIFHLTNTKADCGWQVNAFDEIILDEIKKK